MPAGPAGSVIGAVAGTQSDLLFFDLPREIDVKRHLDRKSTYHLLSLFALFLAGVGSLTLWTLSGVPVSARQAAAASPPQSPANDQPSAHSDFPTGEGKDAFLRVCSKCH